MAACRERLGHRDNAHNRFLLARACEAADESAEAVKVLEGTLRHEPDDICCNLALAALLMSQGDRDLERADRLLDRAEQTMRRHLVEEEIRSWVVLRMTFWSLTGQVDLALKELGRLSPERRADERVEALARVLVSVPDPPPSRLPSSPGPGRPAFVPPTSRGAADGPTVALALRAALDLQRFVPLVPSVPRIEGGYHGE